MLLSCLVVDRGNQTDSGNQAKLALVQLSSFLYSLLDVSAVKTKCGGLGQISFQSLLCNVQLGVQAAIPPGTMEWRWWLQHSCSSRVLWSRPETQIG